MNKAEFLNSLENLLSSLPERERKDILYDYQEHIESALETGKSEEEITNELGSPRKIAKQHRAEFYFERADKMGTTGSAFKAILAGVGLSFFNIVFVLPLLITLYVVLISIFLSFVAVAVSGLVAGVAGFFFVPIIPAFAFVLLGVGVTCLGILLAMGSAWMIKIVTLGIVSYGKANVGIVKKNGGNSNE